MGFAGPQPMLDFRPKFLRAGGCESAADIRTASLSTLIKITFFATKRFFGNAFTILQSTPFVLGAFFFVFLYFFIMITCADIKFT
jgi:hypothetical protein